MNYELKFLGILRNILLMGYFSKESFFEPLKKILIFYELCSERSFSTFFNNHNIYVDKELVIDKKLLVDREKSTIKIENKQNSEKSVLEFSSKNHLYILMNKPKNCVCSRVSDQSKTVYEILENHPLIKNKFPQKDLEKISAIGRLDKDTTGLLLFTTNGSFNNYITAEKSQISKTYFVKLKNSVRKAEQDLYEEKLKFGIWLEAEKKAEKVFVENQKIAWESEKTCYFTIEQGIFHQVRRSFASFGNEVEELHRVKIGDLELPKELNLGDIKIFSRQEFEIS